MVKEIDLDVRFKFNPLEPDMIKREFLDKERRRLQIGSQGSWEDTFEVVNNEKASEVCYTVDYFFLCSNLKTKMLYL